MIIKELIEKYKGEVLFDIKESNTDGELTDLVSFDTKELNAIKEDITSKEVYKWSVGFANNKATITIFVKEAIVTNPPTADPSKEKQPSDNVDTNNVEGA